MLLHTWTLSIEEQFYLIWPAILLGLSAYTARVAGPAISTALVIIAMVTFSVAIASDASGLIGRESLLGTLAGYLMLASGSLLALLLCKSRISGPDPSSAWGIVYEIGALIAICLLIGVSSINLEHLPALWQRGAVWLAIISASAMLILASVRSNGISQWCLKRPLLVRTGLISYGLYLWHFPIFYLTDSLLGLNKSWAVALAAIISVLLACLSYVYVETPFRRGHKGHLPFLPARESFTAGTNAPEDRSASCRPQTG